MGRFILKRLGRGVLTIVLVMVIIFFVIRIAPSDPARMLAAEDATEEEIEEIRELWGLNKPYGEQFVIYLRSLVTGDAGMSYQFSNNGVPMYSVTQLVFARIPNTIKLAAVSILFSVLIGVVLGALSAIKPGSLFDNAVTAIGFFVNSFPVFFIGIVMISVFALGLHLFPTGGSDSPAAIILPALTMSTHFSITLTRMTRNEILRIMSGGFIRAVRAKGVSETAVLFVHALRNAAIPIVTLIGLRIGGLLGGSVVVEGLFRWPGIGQLLLTSVQVRDYPTVQFLVPYVALVFVVVNLIVDLLYGVLDPRVSRI